VSELRLIHRPNNAALIEMRLYSVGQDWFSKAHQACGSISNLIAAGATLKSSDFSKTLQDDLEPIAAKLADFCLQHPK
jgi:hypothetical protein